MWRLAIIYAILAGIAALCLYGLHDTWRALDEVLCGMLGVLAIISFIAWLLPMGAGDRLQRRRQGSA